jgi:amidohydrolase
MSLSKELEKAIDDVVDGERAALTKLSNDIHQNPELRFEEHKAASWIAELLRARGFEVEQGVAGMDTALRAKRGNPKGPRVAILGEYDALPEIGHACGHNLIAASAVGAFLAAASVVDRSGGEVTFLGTPAEEGGGGKIKMIEAGCFDGFSAAMMFHPFDRDILAHGALASTWLVMTFRGAPAHAAAAPHDGNSALTACMDTFRLIDGQRVHFRDGVRVHGYITNGGQAVNIIPELAQCELSVRARTVEELERVRKIVERCAAGAAMASSVKVEIVARQGYRDMRNTDMGDVSHVVPSIHPYLAIVDENEALCHQHRFAAASGSDRGLRTAYDAAKALARTAVEVLTDESLRTSIQEEWRAGR